MTTDATALNELISRVSLAERDSWTLCDMLAHAETRRHPAADYDDTLHLLALTNVIGWIQDELCDRYPAAFIAWAHAGISTAELPDYMRSAIKLAQAS